MIKKLLGYLIVFVLVICAYFCVFKGLTIGNLEISSYKQMIATKENYDKKIDEYNNLVNNEYQAALQKLSTAKTTFETSKEAYEELKQYNSYEELLLLARDKQYPLEFLWIKLDLIAKNNDLNATFSLTNSAVGTAKDINITLAGDYLSVKNYIYDILIDLDLQFKAENIVIQPSGSDVMATFIVKDVNVIM